MFYLELHASPVEYLFYVFHILILNQKRLDLLIRFDKGAAFAECDAAYDLPIIAGRLSSGMLIPSCSSRGRSQRSPKPGTTCFPLNSSPLYTSRRILFCPGVARRGVALTLGSVRVEARNVVCPLKSGPP